MSLSVLKKTYKKIPYNIREKISFYRTFGRFPDLKKPQTFNEKILYRKRNSCLSDSTYSELADKYLVRKYVEEKIGSEYLIELLFATDSISELRGALTTNEDYVLKPNHGASMVAICDGKQDEHGIENLIRISQKWLSCDYSMIAGEKHYSKIKRKILLERRIGNMGDVLTDYKLHLFRQNNNEWFYVLQMIDDRFKGNLVRTFYVNNLKEVYSGNHQLDEKTKSLIEKMIELSKVLIGDLEYARMDWYINANHLYFGEITLTPAAGVGTGYGKELDLLMGQQWNLELAPR